MYRRIITFLLLFPLFALITPTETEAQDLSLTPGVDLVNKYVWRGLELGGNAFNVQPSMTFAVGGFSAGFWAAYPLVDNAAAEEIDTWLEYGFEFPGGQSLSFIVTDYYFPNAVHNGNRLKWGYWDNYDGDEHPGAHTVEVGASFSGCEKFPITLSAYMNVYNDEGNSMYFELAYNTSIQETGFSAFIGATPGSEENPGYYGTENFDVINLGITASRDIKITDDFSLPLFTSYIMNPRMSISYFVFGVSL